MREYLQVFGICGATGKTVLKRPYNWYRFAGLILHYRVLVLLDRLSTIQRMMFPVELISERSV